MLIHEVISFSKLTKHLLLLISSLSPSYLHNYGCFESLCVITYIFSKFFFFFFGIVNLLSMLDFVVVVIVVVVFFFLFLLVLALLFSWSVRPDLASHSHCILQWNITLKRVGKKTSNISTFDVFRCSTKFFLVLFYDLIIIFKCFIKTNARKDKHFVYIPSYFTYLFLPVYNYFVDNMMGSSGGFKLT